MLNCIATKPDARKILFQLRKGGEVEMNIAKHICKVFGIPCEYATALGYCQFTACVKVRPEGVRRG